MWLPPDQDPREITEQPRGERAVVEGYLRRYRQTFELKLQGLDAEQLARRSVPPSSMSLLGLLRHLAGVEHSWNRRALQGHHDLPRLEVSSRADDHDWDFNGAVATEECVEQAWAAWREEVADAEAWLGQDDYDRRRRRPRRRGGGARHRGAPGGGVRAALRPRRPAAGVHRREDRPVSELETLRAWIEDFRRAVVRKTDGLDAEQLARRSVPPSTLSLLGLVRHLAQLEHHWFVRVLQRRDEPQLFVVDGDWDSQFDGALPDPALVAEAFATWGAACAETDRFLDGLPGEALDVVLDPDDRIRSIRDVLLQVLQEYARHCGHLDLLREAIDGATGE